jgi:hypothetical protein
VTPSAISHAVRVLEARVGAALFIRTTRSVGLTEAGERFLSRAKAAFEELVAASEVARDLGQRPTGLLRLTVPQSAFPRLTIHGSAPSRVIVAVAGAISANNGSIDTPGLTDLLASSEAGEQRRKMISSAVPHMVLPFFRATFFRATRTGDWVVIGRSNSS